MSLSKTTKSYTYRSVGGGNADINVEYNADLSNLSRLEVRYFGKYSQRTKSNFGVYIMRNRYYLYRFSNRKRTTENFHTRREID